MDSYNCKKETWLYHMWKKIKPHIGDKAMSTSILNHTFKIPGVQHISTGFLKAKPSLMLESIPIT